MLRFTSLSALLFFSATSASEAAFTPYGFQSGKDVGSSYAGGMVYDKSKHLLFVTGQTYGEYFLGQDLGLTPNPVASNCFLGIAKLPSSDSNSNKFEWLHTQEMGNSTVPEACTSLIHYPHPHNKLYAIGHSEEGGTVTRIRPAGSTKSRVYGIMADFDVKLTTSGANSGEVIDASLTLKGGRLLHPYAGAHYPMAASPDYVNNGFYMAAMSATNSNPSDQTLPESQSKPDLTKGGWRKYGRRYKMILQYLRPREEPIAKPGSSLNETLQDRWTFTGSATDGNKIDVNVHVTSVQTINPTTLLAAGSTSGFGPSFGEGRKEGLGSDRTDTDGFVTKIDPRANATKLQKAVRIGSDQDDYINAMCHNDNSLFVVGTTYGVLRQSERETSGAEAFVVKMDIATMDILWIRQFRAVPGPNWYEDPEYEEEYDTHAIVCAVTRDGESVYVAGNVDEGALLIEEDDVSGVTKTSSLGGDDVFLMQLSAENGNVNYMVQEGTSMHDRMAHGGGLVVDKDDNAIIMGTTKGAFMRDKEVADDHYTDIFFLSFDKTTGHHLTSIEREKVMNGGGIAPTSPPVGTSEDDDDDDVYNYEDDDKNGASNNNDGGLSGGVIAVCVLAGLGIMIVGVCIICRKRKAMGIDLKNSPHVDPVSPYLVNFNYGDVDMKHSATGGFHGVYTDPEFSEGVDKNPNRNSRNMEEIKFDVGASGGGAISSSTFNSAIVTNSLFMDDVDDPQLGASEGSPPGSTRRLVTPNKDDQEQEEANRHSASQRQLSTYDDLLDAYNTTWDDLNPHKLPSSGGLSASGSNRKRKEAESAGLLAADTADDPWGQEII